MYGVEQEEGRMAKGTAEMESSRGGDESRWKSSKSYTHEKLGSEEWEGKECRKEGKTKAG